ncbi:MAG: type II secretion system F family protein [Anaerolineales bacterium]|nr:type II secretion system F family protein [Anaerolineales bacterium]
MMDPIILILIVVVGVGLTGALVYFGLRASSSAAGGGGGDIQVRLEEFAGRATPLTLEEIELSQPFVQRVIRPNLIRLGNALGKFSPSKSRAAAELMLERAGRPYGWGATEFLGLRLFVAVIFGVLTFLITVISPTVGPLAKILAPLVAALIGFVLPVLWIRSKINRRKKEIIKSLPDAMDLLTIAVEAGMGFDGALQKVAEKWDNELSRGFAKVVHEMRLGVIRREALRNMSNNMDVPDVTSFVAAIIQADQLGVSIAKILRVQSEQMRTKRRQRAEEQANKAPIKMLFPMVFLIFPALFVVLLGPAVIILMETFWVGQ